MARIACLLASSSSCRDARTHARTHMMARPSAPPVSNSTDISIGWQLSASKKSQGRAFSCARFYWPSVACMICRPASCTVCVGPVLPQCADAVLMRAQAISAGGAASIICQRECKSMKSWPAHTPQPLQSRAV